MVFIPNVPQFWKVSGSENLKYKGEPVRRRLRYFPGIVFVSDELRIESTPATLIGWIQTQSRAADISIARTRARRRATGGL
jgi:hypothetical protein